MNIFADAGLPMIALAWPWIFVLLAPIILIEVLTAQLPKDFTLKQKIVGIGFANIVSTLVGWPIAWFILVILQIFVIPGGGGAYGINTPLGAIASVTLQSAWLIPYEDQFYWMVPAATAFLMIPFFAISVLSEGLILRACLPGLEPKQRKRAVWRANLFSYGFLIACALAWLAQGLVEHGK